MDTLFKKVRQSLAGAVDYSGHPFRIATLSTTDGQRPYVRSVVLRAISKTGDLVFYVDSRSRKAQHVKTHDTVSVLFYDRENGLQVTITGKGVVDTDSDEAKQIFEGLNESQQIDYKSIIAPSAVLADPTVVRGEEAHFALFKCMPVEIEVLQLDESSQHQRYVYTKSDASCKDWKGQALSL